MMDERGPGVTEMPSQGDVWGLSGDRGKQESPEERGREACAHGDWLRGMSRAAGVARL